MHHIGSAERFPPWDVDSMLSDDNLPAALGPLGMPAW